MHERLACGLVLIVLVAPSLADPEVYRWVDEKGKVHYTDKSPPGGRPQEVGDHAFSASGRGTVRRG